MPLSWAEAFPIKASDYSSGIERRRVAHLVTRILRSVEDGNPILHAGDTCASRTLHAARYNVLRRLEKPRRSRRSFIQGHGRSGRISWLLVVAHTGHFPRYRTALFFQHDLALAKRLKAGKDLVNLAATYR